MSSSPETHCENRLGWIEKPPLPYGRGSDWGSVFHEVERAEHGSPRIVPAKACPTSCKYYLLTVITNCNSIITDCDMTLGEKLRYLREVEGTLRGLDRELSQVELARLVEKELGKSISQSYLSQIESGARPHLTNSTRMLLARFFKVHPGYLVDDPEGFQNELVSDLGVGEDKLDLWLISGAERFCRDVELQHALLTVAKHKDSRMCLILLGEILENPGLAERLIEVLKAPPATAAPKARRR
jgi:transcriptional regulator with XRE-family HTH domain